MLTLQPRNPFLHRLDPPCHNIIPPCTLLQRLSAHLIQVQLSTNPIFPLLYSLLEILQVAVTNRARRILAAALAQVAFSSL